MANHTQGEWFVDYGNHHSFYINCYPDSGGVAEIALVKADYIHSVPVTPDEAEANANLMAAAPDLLAALEEITDQLERIGNSRDVPFIALALVAIAKAKGA